MNDAVYQDDGVVIAENPVFLPHAASRSPHVIVTAGPREGGANLFNGDGKAFAVGGKYAPVSITQRGDNACELTEIYRDIARGGNKGIGLVLYVISIEGESNGAVDGKIAVNIEAFACGKADVATL